MEPTVDDIYSLLQQSSKYNINLKKTGNQIFVYFSELNKEQRKSKLEEIKEYIKQQLPQYASVVAYNKTTRRGSSIGRIEIGRKSANDIVVFVKPITPPTITTAWRINEEAIPKAFNYYKSNNDGENIDIKFVSNNKIYLIEDVINVEALRGNQKTDVVIIKRNSERINLSIKLPKFKTWLSQANSDQEVKRSAEKVIKNLYNPTGTFQKNSVYVKSTLNEAKKACFGSKNEIDYILITQFTNNSFSYENNTLTVNVSEMFSNSPLSHLQIVKKCFMLIEKIDNQTITISPQLKGYKISFVPEDSTENSIPGKR